ncbi:MAG: hypothetical protein AAFN77_21990 [Planctomycetota bacterium]
MVFKWFRRWMRFRRHDDAYARDRQRLGAAVIEALDRQQSLGRTVWLVVHALDVYEQTQQLLEENQVAYDVVTSRIEMLPLVRSKGKSSLLGVDSVKLVLANLISVSHRPETAPLSSTSLAVFVLDRSEDIRDDEQIDSFCRNLPMQVELGYFLSLEDPLVLQVLDPTALIVLEQLGLDQHDLITSSMITSRLDRHLRKQQP